MMKARRLVIACGIAGMLGWLCVFGVGMLVNSKPYRDQLASNFDWKILAKAIMTFTPTNVAVLAMLAGFLGGCASLLMYSDYDPSSVMKSNGKAQSMKNALPTSGRIRSVPHCVDSWFT